MSAHSRMSDIAVFNLEERPCRADARKFLSSKSKRPCAGQYAQLAARKLLLRSPLARGECAKAHSLFSYN